VEALANNASEFGKSLLIVHGDTHTFSIDQPLRQPKDDKKILDSVVRLEVFCERYTLVVRVLVNPPDPMLFAFQPLVIPDNMEFLKRSRECEVPGNSKQHQGYWSGRKIPCSDHPQRFRVPVRTEAPALKPATHSPL
jgi:hypothetical protein